MAYVFTEHSPSTTTYIRSGRGGAGNTFRTADLPPPPTSRSLMPTPTSTSSSPSSSSAGRRFFSGIGGAGNVHEPDHARRPALLRSLESEAAAAAAAARSPAERGPAVGYAGRGGAGNVYSYRAAGRAGSDAGSVASAKSWASDGSTLSAKAKAWATRVVSNF
ncbi:hypothetical protein ESCO_003447 [Escovopsis weberi]|uniref:Uncharacterized protein n=1 Tax=Escovopsis weberi TaxID=150374 RepID=A0A0M8N9U0_ESCWE|nr:hypothetical protein ESCO_003447 [Escovopsis weberi]